jgi:hypothetical protein
MMMAVNSMHRLKHLGLNVLGRELRRRNVGRIGHNHIKNASASIIRTDISANDLEAVQ